MTTYEVTSPAGEILQLHVTDGQVVAAGALTKPCFRPNFIGETWPELHAELEADGWTIAERLEPAALPAKPVSVPKHYERTRRSRRPRGR